MANNRLWLTCQACPDAKFLIAKYLPTHGWRLWYDDDAELAAWLEQHSHGSMWGLELRPELEIKADGAAPKE